MTRLRFAGVGVVVLVLSAMAIASSASAAVVFSLALWLEGGASVVETMLVTTTGELTLENMNAPTIHKPIAVLCSGALVGDVGPNSADDTTELLNLSEVAIGQTALSGTALSCELVAECETGSKVWAVNLPWLTEVELWEIGAENGFVDLILPHTGGGNPGWYVECKIGIIKASEECTMPEGVAEQKNVATGVEDVFSEAFTLLLEAKLAFCNGNNEETGVIKSAGNGSSITVNSLSGVLSVSAAGFSLALWSEGGARVAETMLVTTTGELTLENTNAATINKPAAVLCSGALVGDVGLNSAGDTTELLNLSEEAISQTALSGTALSCELVAECETGSKVWAVNLPWLTEVELWEFGAENGFVDLILPHTGGGNPGWYIECMLAGGTLKGSEECTIPEVVAEQKNVATGVEDAFSEAFTLLMEAKLALCSGNLEETGVIKSAGNGSIVTVNSLSGVLSVSAAGFSLALWLEGGASVVETMLVTTTGELTLENMNAPTIHKPIAVLCSGALVGDVGPNSADDITELLNLSEEAITLTSLAELALSCELVAECETGSKVWAVNLPWLTEVELWEFGTENGFVDLILPHTGGGNPGWYVECKIGIIKASEECTMPEGVAEQKNVATGVEDVFSEAFTLLMEAKLAFCNGNKEETGVIKSAGNGSSITVNSLTSVLSVSSG